MREGISIEVSAADRERLTVVVADRNSPQNHAGRARIIFGDSWRHGCRLRKGYSCSDLNSGFVS
jgi:hypothetical protein